MSADLGWKCALASGKEASLMGLATPGGCWAGDGATWDTRMAPGLGVAPASPDGFFTSSWRLAPHIDEMLPLLAPPSVRTDGKAASPWRLGPASPGRRTDAICRMTSDCKRLGLGFVARLWQPAAWRMWT